MSPGVSIERVAGRYQLPAGPEDPAGLARRLDGLAGGAVANDFASRVPAVLARLGLSEDAAVAVRELSVRVRIRGGEVADAPLVEAWSRALEEALETSLEPLAPGGGLGEDAVVFSDRADAERRYLLASTRDAVGGWWWAPLLGDGEVAPTPGALLERWAASRPHRLAPLLVELAATAAGGLRALLDDRSAQRVTAIFLRAVARRRAVVAGARGPDTALPAGTAAARQRVRGMSPVSRLESLARLLVSRPELSHELPSTESSLAAWLSRHASAERRAPLRQARDRAGSVEGEAPSPVSDPWEGSPPEQEARPGSGFRATEPDQSSGALEHSSVARPAPPRSDETNEWTEPRASVGEPAALPLVGCAGLLFLVRPLLRSTWFAADSDASLSERFEALGRLALARVLDPLGPAERRAALERERAVLGVFCGRDALPDELDAGSLSEALEADAQRGLEELAPRLSPEAALDARGARLVFGSARTRAIEEHLGDPLVRLLVRIGRLRVAPGEADLHLPLDAVDVVLRRASIDVDPGWVPWLGRSIRFHYEQEGWS